MAKIKEIALSKEYLDSILRYDPDSGKLFYRHDSGRWGRIKAGSEAGSIHPSGYRQIHIDGRIYKAHRIVWVMIHGSIPSDLQIDHLDLDKSNNRIENLRLVTNQENHFNRPKVKGCYFHKQSGQWIAKIKARGKRIYLGRFDREEDAEAAYAAAKKSLHFIPDRVCSA